MDDYISICLKRNDGNADDAGMVNKDHAVLLRTIQPTLKNQEQDNQIEAEHAVSTTSSSVKDRYNLIELRLEYRVLRDNCGGNQLVENFKRRTR